MGNNSLQDMPLPFEEIEAEFFKKNNAEKLPSLCGDVIVRFQSYQMISNLYQLLRDYNEYTPESTVFQVTISDEYDVLQCKHNFYRRMVNYWFDIWGGMK